MQPVAVQVDILCTHPMFGPDSGKGSWQGLNFMYERVRIGTSNERQQRLKNLLQVPPLAPASSCQVRNATLESICWKNCSPEVSR